MHEPQHDLLSAYIDHACTPQETEQLTAHLQGCALCRDAMETLRALQRDLRELPSPVLGFDLAARLQDRLQAAPPSSKKHPVRWWRTWQSASLVVAASLVSGLWLGTLLEGTGPRNALPVDITMVRVFDPIPPGSLRTASMLYPKAEELKP